MRIVKKWRQVVRLPNIKDIRRDMRSWWTNRRIDIIKYGFALGSRRFIKSPHFYIFEALFTPNIRSRKSSRTNRQIDLTKYIGYSSPAILPPGDNAFMVGLYLPLFYRKAYNFLNIHRKFYMHVIQTTRGIQISYKKCKNVRFEVKNVLLVAG